MPMVKYFQGKGNNSVIKEINVSVDNKNNKKYICHQYIKKLIDYLSHTLDPIILILRDWSQEELLNFFLNELILLWMDMFN